MPKKKKIYFFETENWERERLAERTDDPPMTLVSGKLSPRTAQKYRNAEAVSTFIYSDLSTKTLEQLPKLKMIATRSTGFDHIDTEYCKKKNIIVANVPTYGENTVAEHAFALILTLTRKVFQAYSKTRSLDFDYHGLRGWDLKGKTLGIGGGGHIGEHMVRMAKGFEMNVVVSDPHHNKRLAKKLGFTYAANLKSLLKRSDIVSLHAPYNKHTHHIINKDSIAHMQKHALLINTARGGLIDTSALVWALDKGMIGGAGLDVLEEECVVREESEYWSKRKPKECDMRTVLENHVLIMRDNVVVTPHIAFNSEEAVERILDTTIKNLQSFLRGRPKNNVIR